MSLFILVVLEQVEGHQTIFLNWTVMPDIITVNGGNEGNCLHIHRLGALECSSLEIYNFLIIGLYGVPLYQEKKCQRLFKNEAHAFDVLMMSLQLHHFIQ